MAMRRALFDIPGIGGGGGIGLPGLPGIGGGDDKKKTPAPAPANLNKHQKKQVRNQVAAVIKSDVTPKLESLFNAVTGGAKVTAYEASSYANGASRTAFSSDSGSGISESMTNKLLNNIPLILIGVGAWFFIVKKGKL